MFTQPCFVRTNDSDIIKDLKDLGYKSKQSIVKNSDNMLFAYNGYYMNNFPDDESIIKKAIDCGTNKKLFLDLAALRNDSDNHQMFIHNEYDDEFTYCSQDEFHCFSICIFTFRPEDHANEYHKATPEEIIRIHKEYLGG